MDYEPTVVPAIMFSDTIIREQGTGKLTLIGCFHKLNADRFPFVAPPFYATVVFANFHGKLEKVNACLRIEHTETGHVVASMAAAFGTNSEIQKSDSFELPFPVPPSIFPAVGMYKAVVLVDNEKIGERDLTVQSITTSTPQPT